MLKRKSFLFMLLVLLVSCSSCLASEIKLSDEEILVNDVVLSEKNGEGIIYSNQMNNGSTSLEGMEANIKIDDVITITKAGEYTFKGSLSNGQIAVDANKIEGDVKIILDNVNITCDDAPAIFVFSKDIESEKCKVTISTTKDSVNTVSGGKIKTSVEGWADQENVLYSIEKNYDDNHEYYERYKYDGAISSDISITFDGEGTLNVNGNAKEGIEGKMHITVNGGNLLIRSVDDAINAAADGKSVIKVNDGMVVAFIRDDAEEGDGIDSNGSIQVNGGTVYSFASPGADSGLDADLGTKINGGTVLATGSMADSITFSDTISSSKATFNQGVKEGESVCVANEDGDVVFAYKTDRNIQNFFYTSPNLENGKNYKVYTNASIEGEVDEWGVYTNINSSDIENATQNDFNEMQRPGGFMGDFDTKRNQVPTVAAVIALVASAILLIIVLVIDINDKETGVKIKVINLIFGILIGIFLASGILILVNNDMTSSRVNMGNMQFEDRQNGGMTRPDMMSGDFQMNRNPMRNQNTI